MQYILYEKQYTKIGKGISIRKANSITSKKVAEPCCRIVYMYSYIQLHVYIIAAMIILTSR